MKLMILNVISALAALSSLICAVRALTLSASEKDAARRKKVWFFGQRAGLTTFFALQLATLGQGSGDLFRFYLFLFGVLVGVGGMIFEYAGASRGLRHVTEAPAQNPARAAAES